jgi:hypothetical protein
VDGEKTNYSGACGMSAPAAWANAQKQAQSGDPTGVKSVKCLNQKNIISSGEFFINQLSLLRGLFRAFPNISILI